MNFLDNQKCAYYTNGTCIFLLPQYTAFTIYSYQLAADKLVHYHTTTAGRRSYRQELSNMLSANVCDIVIAQVERCDIRVTIQSRTQHFNIIICQPLVRHQIVITSQIQHCLRFLLSVLNLKINQYI